MNVALIGLKGHYHVVLDSLKHMDDLNITAVWDDDPAALEGVLSWIGERCTPTVYSDWRELLDNERLDVMCSNMRHSEQAEVLLECCRRGINILPEKPLTKTWEEYEQVRAAVEHSGVHISLLLTMRFEAHYRALREQVLSGQVGEVAQVTSQKSYRLGDRPQWMRDSATFAGIIPFIGCHALDLIMWSTGLNIVEVMACQGNNGRPELRDMENHATVLARLENGASASARVDFCRPAQAPTHGDDRLRVAGSHGVAESRYPEEPYLRLVTDTQPPTDLQPPQIEPQFVNFARSIRGETECVTPAADVWRITEVCLRARDAAISGQPQRV